MLALLLGLISPQAHLDAKITFTAPAARAEPLMEKLSQASGVHLAVSQVVGQEVLFIKVKNVPLKDLMDRMADVVNGSWEKDKDLYRLVRTPADIKKETEEETTLEAKEIAEALKPLLKHGEGAFDAARAQAVAHAVSAYQKERGEFSPRPEPNAPMYSSPLKRSLLRLIGTIEPRDMTRLISGERLVYSTNPTRMQRRLKASNELQQLRQEHAIWVEALSKLPPHEPEDRFEGDPLIDNREWNTPPATLILQVMASERFEPYMFRMNVLAESGASLTSDSLFLAPNRVQQGLQEMQGKPRVTNDFVPLSELSRKFLSASRALIAKPGTADVTPALRDFLLNPEKQDPMSANVTDCFVAVAEQKGVNVVANVHDELLSAATRNEKPTVTAFLDMAWKFCGMSIEEKSGWLTAEPLYPTKARAMRADRTALGRLTRSIVSNGRLTLDEQAIFALNARKAPRLGFEHLPVLLLGGQTGYGFGDGNWRALQLYATLTQGHRQRLLDGDGIPFAELSQRQKQILSAWIYCTTQFNGRSVPGKPMPRGFTEPTIFLPNGLPGTGTLRMTSQVEPVAFLVSDSGRISNGVFNPQNLAYQMFERQKAVPGEWRQNRLRALRWALRWLSG
jgi:hypothetical protein